MSVFSINTNWRLKTYRLPVTGYLLFSTISNTPVHNLRTRLVSLRYPRERSEPPGFVETVVIIILFQEFGFLRLNPAKCNRKFKIRYFMQ
jgi:hypothetical protein